jgi:rhodanese-related sulfurtransferase
MKRRTTLFMALIIVSLFAAGLLYGEGFSAAQLVGEAKRFITETSTNQANELFSEGGYVFIDVREPNETKMGHVPGAILLPRGLLEFKISGAVEDQDTKIIVYCKSGSRSALAAFTLARMGYENVLSMAGGFIAWADAGFPIEE